MAQWAGRGEQEDTGEKAGSVVMVQKLGDEPKEGGGIRGALRPSASL